MFGQFDPDTGDPLPFMTSPFHSACSNATFTYPFAHDILMSRFRSDHDAPRKLLGLPMTKHWMPLTFLLITVLAWSSQAVAQKTPQDQLRTLRAPAEFEISL